MGCVNSTPTEVPARAVFRPTRLAYLFPLALAVFAIPAAFGAPWFWLIYLVPVAIVYWLARTRTVVDAEAVTGRGGGGGPRVTGVGLPPRRGPPAPGSGGPRVSAGRAGGGGRPCPAVNVRGLSQLAAVSGGRLPDPAGE